MTATAPPEAPPDEMTREDLMASATALALFYRTNPDAELPDGRTLHKRVLGLTYGDRVVELYRIAASWGVDVEPPMRDRTLIARRKVGSITLAAVLSPPDASLADYHARIAQRRAGTGTEAA
jgi:hypothetical protein